MIISNILWKGNLLYFSNKYIGQIYFSVHFTLIKVDKQSKQLLRYVQLMFCATLNNGG